jgi:hypothetical protein
MKILSWYSVTDKAIGFGWSLSDLLQLKDTIYVWDDLLAMKSSVSASLNKRDNNGEWDLKIFIIYNAGP